MSIKDLQSPMGEVQPFIWFAKYNDDSLFTEFEEDKKENEFSKIDKENLKEFGILGKGVKFYYSAKDGIIWLKDVKGNGNYFEFYLKDENENIIKLSDRNDDKKYNDIVQYKGFHQDFELKSKNALHGLVIDSYHIGYKYDINIEDRGHIYFRALLRYETETGKGIKLGFRFAPTFNLKGKLFVKIDSDDPSFGTSIKEIADVNILAESSGVYEVEIK
jgi:hypothetical protein